jgi:hypothetical protein
MEFLLYKESSSKALFLEEIEAYVEDKFPGARVRTKGGFINEYYGGEAEGLAENLAELKVIDPSRPFTPNEPMYGEVQFELRVLEGKASPAGILYDGPRMDALYREMLPGGMRSLDILHIVFTDRLLGTFDPHDLRYHARVNICGYPHLISMAGLVEAPAKPKEFYLEKQFHALGDAAAHEALKKKYKGRFLDYGDPRTTEVAKGYVMQGIFYQLTGEAFCPDKNCRLYNAHWQEEMLKAQLSEPEFCKRHTYLLENLKSG